MCLAVVDRVGVARWGLPVVVVLLAVLAAFPALAHAAPLSWSGSVSLDRAGSQSLTGVACPLTTQCTAVDAVGQVVTFNPTAPGTPKPTTIDVGQSLNGVACPSATQCTAVDGTGRQLTFNPTNPGTPTPVIISSGSNLRAVACPSANLCVAVDSVGKEVTFNPTSTAASTVTTIDSGQSLNAVACTSVSQCVAVDARGYAVTFDPATPGNAVALPVDSGNRLSGVACPSADQCTAVEGGQGRQVTFNPNARVPTTPTTVAPGGLYAVACPSTTRCTAVDYQHQTTFNPTNPGTPTPTIVAPNAGAVTAVACPSATQCTGVTSTGRQVTFDPTNPGTPTPRLIDGGPRLNAVTCPSASQCTAVDDGGRQVTFNPNAPGTPAPTAIDTGSSGDALFLSAVACPSTTQCTAVDKVGRQMTFNPNAPPGTPEPKVIGANRRLNGVACPLTIQCTAVDEYGLQLTFDPTDGTLLKCSSVSSSFLNAVACPSATQCTAVDTSGRQATFDPTTPGPAAPVTIASGQSLNGVACPSATQCTAVDGIGRQVTFNPTPPAGTPAPTPVTVDSGQRLNAVACPSVSLCVAVDGAGRVVEGDPRAGSWTLTALVGANQLFGVACRSAVQCVAVDRVGNGFVGRGAVPVNTALPSISGTATQGQTLTEAPGTWSNDPESYSYQWQRCTSAGASCTAIAGATAQTYTLTAEDVGSTIRVQETASNGAGPGVPATSAQTAVVAAPAAGAPVSSAPPSISGQAMQGRTLTESHGTWSKDPTGYGYQWQRCNSAGASCTAIAGATGQTYTLTGDDVGSTIRVQETASNAAGPGFPATSAQTAVALAAGVPESSSPPSISGTTTQGQTLTESHGTWSNSPTGYAYQWQRCNTAGASCTAIAGAAGQTYTLTGEDVGSTIRLQETARNAAGPGAPATSDQTAVVAGAGSGYGNGSGSGGQAVTQAPGPPFNANTIAGPDIVAPAVMAYTLTSNRFVVGGYTPIVANAAAGNPKPRAKRPRTGTTFAYTLSEAATVRIAIARKSTGRRNAKGCVAPSAKLRKAKKCIRLTVQGTLTRTSRQGANTVAFSGRIGSKALNPGRYQATLTATDAAKNTSKPKTIFFTIVRR